VAIEGESAATEGGLTEEELEDLAAEYYDNPLDFVLACFPWGEPGPLEKFRGPDEWQRQGLREIGQQVRERAFDGFTPVAPIRRAISSGHGIGKSALTAIVVLWLMSPHMHSAHRSTNAIPGVTRRTEAARRRRSIPDPWSPLVYFSWRFCASLFRLT
jgi:hypothetical protein